VMIALRSHTREGMMTVVVVVPQHPYVRSLRAL